MINKKCTEMHKHKIKNSCGKKGCFISLRVLPYGEYDRRKYQAQIDRTVKAISKITKESKEVAA